MTNLTAEISTFHAGEMIFSEFERGDKFYLIQSGSVEIVKILGNVTKILAVLSTGDMFGEMALLEDSPRSASAIAAVETKVMVFDRDNFQNLMLGNPATALKLLKMFTKRIYESKRRLMILTLSDANMRVADVFLMFDEISNTSNGHSDSKIDTKRRELEVSVENIASWACITVNQARNAIDHYIKLGYIEHYKDKVIIKDINNFIRLVNAARSRQPKTTAKPGSGQNSSGRVLSKV